VTESSARPADLDGWASASRRLDETVATHKSTLDRLHTQFTGSLGWGYFDASSLLAGLGTWLNWNEIDARWVSTIAQAFRDAGTGSVSDDVIEGVLRAAGLDTPRVSVTFDDPIALGEPPTSGYANDPVNCATGNFVEVEHDLPTSGLLRLLGFSRTYNSRSDRVGPCGPGWASWATCRLRAEPDGAHWEGPDGQRAVVPRLGSAGNGPGYGRLAGVAGVVVPAGDGLAIDWFGGARTTFDATGRPVLASDGPGTEVRFVHEGDRLTHMRHSGGRALTFEWAGDRIVAAVCSDGRRVDYRYDFDGRLVEAHGPAGMRRYEVDNYDRVTAVIDADGVVEVANRYDEAGRVVGQGSPHGRWTRFRYLQGRVTIVDDDSGGPVNTYIHDDQGRLVRLVDGHGEETIKTYDAWGNPIEIVERNGAVTRQEWNDRGRLVRRIGPDGEWFAFGYDELDRVTVVTASDGAVTRYRYSGAERSPTEMVDPEAGVTRLEVEGGLVRRVTDPDGVVVRFGFDADGRLTSISDGDGHTAVIERDGAGRVTATASPMGLRTELSYDSRGRLVERRDPGGGVWRFEWTGAGRPAATVDPTGARTEIRYGRNGEAEQTVDPLGQLTTRRFDPLANLVGVVLPDGAKWEFTYDGLCRLTGVHDPAGATWLREYDVNGNVVGSIDPVGAHRTATVDGSGRVTGVDDGATSVGFDYDKLGRATVHRRPDGTDLTAAYDRCGRTTSITDPLGGVTRYTWTPAGRLATVTSPLGAVTTYEYDRCGRRVAVVDPLGHRWSYRFDGDGRVTQVVAPTGEIERFRYDSSGRLAVRRSPSGGDTAYAYDGAGRVVAVTDPMGGVRRFGYDPAGRLIEATDPNGGVTRYERNARGRVSALVDPIGGRVEHRYDEVGRLVARTDQLGRTTEWAYDPAGRVVRRVLPTGERVRWWYDDSGRVTCIGAGADDGPTVHIARDLLARPTVIDEPGFRHQLTWDAAGRLIAKRRNDLELTWRYDADGNRIATGLADGTETGFEFDPAGRTVAAHHPGFGTVTFERDAAGRLTGFQSAAVDEGWSYRDGLLVDHSIDGPGGRRVTHLERDPTGRVVAAATDDITGRYGYDPAGQLATVSGSEGQWTFAYDRAGRLATETRPDDRRVDYLYDAAHQLTERRSTDHVTRYAHDPAGRRVAEDGPTGSRRYTWDGFGRLSSVDDTRLRVDVLGDLARVDERELLWDPVATVPRLRWLDGITVVGDDRPWATTDPSGSVDWLDADHQGSLGGAHDPWGAGASTGVGLAYRGELTIDDLIWLRARPYHPVTRAFLSTDPLPGVPGDPFVANPYHYAGNDPIGALDPLGLRPLTEAELAQHIDALNNNMFERAGDWVADNWEYIAAGALIVAGGAIMLTGVGGPIGAAMIGGALLSGGLSAGSQRLMTGEVNWGQVAVDGAIGGLARGGGAYLASAGMVTRIANPVIRGTVVGGAEGLMSGTAYQGINYARTGEFDPTAIARDTLLGGGLGGAGARLTGVRAVDPGAMRFSQTSVNNAQEIIDDMGTRGWRGAPVDVVQMSDGGLTTVDNTRLLAARLTDTPVQARVHPYDAPIDPGRAPTLSSPKGDVPQTWGEGVENRIQGQNRIYRETYPQGSGVIGWRGN
jgi:RHS repeat-associated protein